MILIIVIKVNLILGRVAFGEDDSSMIRVFDEKTFTLNSMKRLCLKLVDRLDFETFTLVYLSNSETEFELELTINKNQKNLMI